MMVGLALVLPPGTSPLSHHGWDCHGSPQKRGFRHQRHGGIAGQGGVTGGQLHSSFRGASGINQRFTIYISSSAEEDHSA